MLLRPIVRSCEDGQQPGSASEAWEDADDTPLVVEGNRRYRLEMGEVADGTFYRVEVRANEIVVVLNTLHEFYQCFEREFRRAQAGGVAGLRKTLELVLLALGRSHFVVLQDDEDEVIERFVAEWSRAVAVFCGASPKER